MIPASATLGGRARVPAEPRSFRWTLPLILAAALALRLWGIADRLPDPTLGIDPMDDTAVDEGDRRAALYAWEMWRGGTAPLDLNPATGDWPGLSFYVTLGLQVLYRGYWAVAHPGGDAASFARHVETDPSALFLFARIANALAGVLTIHLACGVGSRAAGRGAGLVAALLLAFNPSHIFASQRVSDPNLLSLLFLLSALFLLLRFLEAPSVGLSARAGALIGLAGASKYVPVAALVALIAAHLERPGRRGFAWQSLAAGVAACAGAFFLASPFTILDWPAKSVDLALQRGRLLGDWVGQTSFPIALPTYLVQVLPDMLGWPAYLLSLAGGVLLWRSGASGRVVALIPLALLVPNGLLALAQGRFMLPALGCLEVMAAATLVAAHARLAARGVAAREGAGTRAGAASLVAVAAVSLTALAWPLPSFLAARRALALKDTRHVARRWIEASLPLGDPMALDLYGPVYRLAPEGRFAVVWPFLATQSPLVRAAYHPEWLDGFRYYATSSEVTRRFEASRREYSLEADFYRWIRDRGRRVWTSDSARAAGPTIEIWALPSRISTPEERAGLWSRVAGDTAYTHRLARWCTELADVFSWGEDHARAEEWGRRGLELGTSAPRRRLTEVLALARLRLGGAAEAERVAGQGLEAFPESPLLHVYRAAALEALSRHEEALAEYREALPLCPNENAAALVRGSIARLEASRGARDAGR